MLYSGNWGAGARHRRVHYSCRTRMDLSMNRTRRTNWPPVVVSLPPRAPNHRADGASRQMYSQHSRSRSTTLFKPSLLPSFQVPRTPKRPEVRNRVGMDCRRGQVGVGASRRSRGREQSRNQLVAKWRFHLSSLCESTSAPGEFTRILSAATFPHVDLSHPTTTILNSLRLPPFLSPPSTISRPSIPSP